MSNNPFLKSNESNNRFKFLYDDTRESFKEPSNKFNKRNEYEPSQNSFTQYHRENKSKRQSLPPPIEYLEPIIETSTKYKDILSNVIKDNTQNENSISPGWTEITHLNGKSFFKHGPPTLKQQKLDNQKELENQRENNPNYIMLKLNEILNKNWDLNEKIYNSINGEGAYVERFILPYIYGSEYYSQSDEDDDYSDEDNITDN